MSIICFVGYSGCGKTTIGNLLSTQCDMKIINVSDIIKTISQDKETLGLDVTNNTNVLTEIDKQIEHDDVIVIGPREQFITDFLVDKYDAQIFYFNVDEKTRWDRLRNERKLSQYQIVTKDIVERQIGLSRLINYSPYICEIKNDTPDKMIKCIKILLQ